MDIITHSYKTRMADGFSSMMRKSQSLMSTLYKRRPLGPGMVSMSRLRMHIYCFIKELKERDRVRKKGQILLLRRWFLKRF